MRDSFCRGLLGHPLSQGSSFPVPRHILSSCTLVSNTSHTLLFVSFWLIHAKQVLTLAMKLGHSRKVLSILTTILEPRTDLEHVNSEDKLTVNDQMKRLDPYVTTWTDEETEKVCAYLVDWNTNARHTFTCQCLLASLVRVKRALMLGKTSALREGCSALSAYGERHFLRMNKLYQASFALDYMVSQK